jgi:carboxypeptidase C (cathepsin A)
MFKLCAFRLLPFFIFILVVSSICNRTWAGPEEKSIPSAQNTELSDIEPEKVSETQHRLALTDQTLSYSAVAGELIVKRQVDGKTHRGRIFYVYYAMAGVKRRERPITFAFNGGPGAASVWLHLGGLGPKRIKLADNGKTLPPPAQYEDNPHTWLDFSDLVFVDPVGTGFSKSDSDENASGKYFYGFQQDIETLGEFIRLFLTRNNRWLSPKYLVGASYGTTRVAGLVWYLQQRYGIDVNGIVFISPVLDYDTILFHPSNDLPYLLFFPTYTATAYYHGKLQSTLKQRKLEDLLAEVESFCLEDYLVSLSKGENITDDKRKTLLEKIRSYTGLPADIIEKLNFRINWIDFTKGLIKSENRLIGRMDSTMTGIDPDPTAPYPKYDPSLDPLFGPFSTAMNAYVREDLKFETDHVYEFLNSEVNKNWDWTSGLIRKQGFIDVSHTLRDTIAVNKDLKILIACGLYDLATPYFSAKYTVSHMWLGKQRSNVSIKYYKSGHMMYTHNEELKILFQDAKQFYLNGSK